MLSMLHNVTDLECLNLECAMFFFFVFLLSELWRVPYRVRWAVYFFLWYQQCKSSITSSLFPNFSRRLRSSIYLRICVLVLMCSIWRQSCWHKTTEHLTFINSIYIYAIISVIILKPVLSEFLIYLHARCGVPMTYVVSSRIQAHVVSTIFLGLSN